MKPAIIGVIAFVAGVAGGTALAKGPVAPLAGADSSHAETTPPPAATEPLPEPDTSAQTAAQAAAAPAGPAAAPKDTVTPPAAFDAKRMADILGKLPAADVPPLLTQFNDADLELVLRRLDVEHVAAVIASLPKERGAAISRRLIVPGKPE